jgi:hypothetical protein
VGGDDTVKLHVLYRSTGGENRKNRPAFYSKLLALASLTRALDALQTEYEIVFLNDGTIPNDRLTLMIAFGAALSICCGSNRASYRYALRLPRRRGWAPDDLVWFAEDDYLYRPESMTSFVSAAEALPDASYFSVYTEDRLDPGSSRWSPTLAPDGRATNDPDAIDVGGVRWYRAAGTTSSFGARVGTVVDDERLLRGAALSGGAWDYATCLAYQGFRPSAAEALVRLPDLAMPPRPLSHRIGRAGAQVIMDAVALSRPAGRHRRLVAADPDLATHLEEPFLSPGTDWAALAESTEEWLAETGGLPRQRRSAPRTPQAVPAPVVSAATTQPLRRPSVAAG